MKKHFRDSWNVWREKVNAALGTVEQIDASEVLFDNDDTDLTADDVQEAIEEVNTKANTIALDISQLTASHIGFVAGETGMTADDVQEAIEELNGVTSVVHGNYVVNSIAEVTVNKEGTETWGAMFDKLATAVLAYIQSLDNDTKVQVMGIVGTVHFITVYPPSLLGNNLQAFLSYFITTAMVTNGHTLSSAEVTTSGSKFVTSTLTSTSQTFGNDRSNAEAPAATIMTMKLLVYKEV